LAPLFVQDRIASLEDDGVPSPEEIAALEAEADRLESEAKEAGAISPEPNEAGDPPPPKSRGKRRKR